MSISGIHGQVLEVTVVECQKLKDTEWLSRQDPYVCLEYGSTKFRTRTCTDGGKHPVFQEKFVFPLIEGLREINVVVWNSNTLTYDDFIGSGKIQIQDVLSRGYDDRPWPLQTKTGSGILDSLRLSVSKPLLLGCRFAGEIKLIMHYANANKPTSYAPSAPPYAAPPTPQVPLYSTPPPASLSAYPPPATAYPPPSTAYPSSGYTTASPHPFYPPSTAAYSPYSYPPPHDPSVYPPPPYPPPSAYPPPLVYPPPPYPPPPRHPPPYGPPGTCSTSMEFFSHSAFFVKYFLDNSRIISRPDILRKARVMPTSNNSRIIFSPYLVSQALCVCLAAFFSSIVVPYLRYRRGRDKQSLRSYI
ncbi:Elicitor-responsive protein 1-like protein [Drosera capensis]